MQSLFNQLTNLSKTGMITAAGQHNSIAVLIAKAEQIRQQYPQFHQRSIAIRYTNLTDFVTSLIAFDGHCSTMYLRPPNLAIPHNDIIDWPLESDVAVVDSIPSRLKSEAVDSVATACYIATSGTTREPRWCPHSFLSLTSNTKHTQKLTAL